MSERGYRDPNYLDLAGGRDDIAAMLMHQDSERGFRPYFVRALQELAYDHELDWDVHSEVRGLYYAATEGNFVPNAELETDQIQDWMLGLATANAIQTARDRKKLIDAAMPAKELI